MKESQYLNNISKQTIFFSFKKWIFIIIFKIFNQSFFIKFLIIKAKAIDISSIHCFFDF